MAHVKAKGEGWVFRAADFLDLANRAAVDQALARLAKKRVIHRLGRGLYQVPQVHPLLGPLRPTVEAIAQTLQESHGTALRLQPSGAYAANLLGISEQVPTRIVFLTDGPARKFRLGEQEIILKHTTPRNMATAGRVSGLVIQALRHLGKQHADETVLRRLCQRLTREDRDVLLRDIGYAPAWIAQIIQIIHRLTEV